MPISLISENREAISALASNQAVRLLIHEKRAVRRNDGTNPTL